MDLTVNVLQWVGENAAPSAFVVSIGGISINGSTNGVPGSSHTVTIPDGSKEVEIVISESGYHTYKQTIQNVFFEDLSIDVLLVEEVTDINNAAYLQPHERFFTIQDPCSYDLYVYNGSSYSGSLTWYIDNNMVCKDDWFLYQFANSDSYQIKVAGATFRPIEVPNACGGVDIVMEPAWLRQWASDTVHETGNLVIGQDVSDADLVTYLGLDTATNTTIKEWRPDISTKLSSADSFLNNKSTYSQYTTMTITSLVELNRPNQDPYLTTVTFKVYDPDGGLIDTKEQPFATSTPNTYDLYLNDIGTYKVEVIVTDLQCGTTTVDTAYVETTNFLYLETTGTCSEFVLYNKSLDYSVDYSIELVGEGGTDGFEGTLEPDSEFVFTLSDIGIHQVVTKWQPTSDPASTTGQVLIVNNWCELWDCLAGYASKLLCGDNTGGDASAISRELPCNDCPDALTLNQMMMYNYTYSMMMNAEYEFNNFYNGLFDSELKNYADINAMAEDIKKYCSRIKCNDPQKNVTQTTSGSTAKGGCGCG